MSLIKAGLGAVAGATLGAALWVAVGYYTGFEVGLIAWAMGAAAGIGAMLFVGQPDCDTNTGVIAAVIALLAVLGAKYAVAYAVVERDITQFLPAAGQYTVTDNDLKAAFADEIVTQREEAGKPITWPQHNEENGPTYPEEYPTDIVAEASKKWDALTTDQQLAKRTQAQADLDQGLAEFIRTIKPTARTEVFKASFGLFDLLWLGLAIASAFKLGSGLGND